MANWRSGMSYQQATSGSSDGMMALGSQRLSARHAARALVNLFAPSLATCVGYKSGNAEPIIAEAKEPGHNTGRAKLAGIRKKKGLS